ncbi:hypothetical protein AB0B25_13555 [Nocardia sp. NPDC049190]|uniref:hypothetical protein n=1 Tax=Nocardia sp. NPDC049190 TaxID=3155650 RepID=UPI0033DF0E93
MTLLAAGSARVFVRVAGLSLCLVFGLGAHPAAVRAEPAYGAYLDLPVVNGDGMAGGLNAVPPLDEAVLSEAVQRARADGVTPRRYATLLHQYWLVGRHQ